MDDEGDFHGILRFLTGVETSRGAGVRQETRSLDQSNLRMIFPKCSLACIRRCAVGASAAGITLYIGGRSLPASSAAPNRSRNAATICAFSAAPRLRKVDPNIFR